MGQDKPRKDPFERRTIWALALAVIALVFPSTFNLGIGGPDWWNAAFWIAGQTAFVLSVGAAALALMPQRVFLPAALAERDRGELVSVALMLLWLGLALMALNLSILAVDVLSETDF